MQITPDARRALEALASEHGVPILRFLRGRDWVLASRVAEGLGIHTTTASKHLAAFHEAGLIDRKPHAAKRPTFAYRLRSPVIRLELDLAERAESADVAEAAEAFMGALLEASHRVGGARLSGLLVRGLFGVDDWRPVLRARIAAADPRATLDAFVRDAQRRCADAVGSATAQRLLSIALESGFEGRRDLMPEAFL